MKKIVISALSGLIFAAGLVISGMTQPAKVLGFLNIAGLQNGVSWRAQTGYWDPSLAFVMGGALIVTFIAFSLQPKQAKPWFELKFDLPSLTKIDRPLLIGSALFGIGWGLAGYCPGPALASISQGSDALIFTVAMLLGMWIAKRLILRIGDN